RMDRKQCLLVRHGRERKDFHKSRWRAAHAFKQDFLKVDDKDEYSNTDSGNSLRRLRHPALASFSRDLSQAVPAPSRRGQPVATDDEALELRRGLGPRHSGEQRIVALRRGRTT